MFVGERSGGLQ